MVECVNPSTVRGAGWSSTRGASRGIREGHKRALNHSRNPSPGHCSMVECANPSTVRGAGWPSTRSSRCGIGQDTVP